MALSLHVGSDIIRSYRRLAYTPWHALAELIDNSTQSYYDNRALLDEALKNSGQQFEVRIVYDRDNDLLRISDNALGMNMDDMTLALKIGRPPANVSGRSQYGLGLKTASCWLGDEWTIKTKRLGELHEIEVTVNVENVANGDTALPDKLVAKEAKLHYTIVEIRKLHMRIKGRTLGKIRDFLRSMYRDDIRKGAMRLYWENAPLSWDQKLKFLKRVDGSEYRKTIDCPIGNKRVTGWIGILEEGSRTLAGFAVLRRGRVLRAHPNEWRPEKIFGIGGRNDLINQRLTGELSFDDFEVSHTKDAIHWVGDEEDAVEDKLKEEANDFLVIARAPRKGGGRRGPTELETQTATDQLKSEMESKEFVDTIELEDVPPPPVVQAAKRPIIDAANRAQPRFDVKLADTHCRVYLSTDASPNDPYFATDIGSKNILVVINTNHPHWEQLQGAEGVLNYMRDCVYDAVAEWQCSRKEAVLRTDTIKLLKDRLLRLPFERQNAPEETSSPVASS